MSTPKNHYSKWRAWALLLVLNERDGWTSARYARRELEQRGWDVFNPHQGHQEMTKATRYTLTALEKRGYLQHRTRESINQWHLTPRGAQYVADHLLDNPHITPAACRADHHGVTHG